MKKILLSLLLFAPLVLFGQITELDSTIAKATGGTRYQFLKLDSVITQSNKHVDSVLSLRTAINQNYGFIQSHADSITTFRSLINANTLKVTFPGFTSLITDYSFTDNSSNWNTAYGWGDHSGLYSVTSHNHSGTYEPVLGNPSTNGYVLSSTTGGTRSWVAQSGGTAYDTTYLYSLLHDTVSLVAGSGITLDISDEDTIIIVSIDSSAVKFLDESWHFFTYGYGSYVDADSVLADSGRIYGAKYILIDSIDFTYAVPMLSTGDSIVVRAMYNDTVAINGTVLDTLYLGSSVAPIDISSWPTLPLGQIVWLQSMESIPTKDPIFMELELYGIIKRD